ncbi:uncharacterized protein FIESC28_01020 [Fusarium coffeatum]|uniref:Uncharacterized protein n=1 Tax=Fusarium coffeatum TaxID=231269 RepID=A0A366SA81_9HYPO|nr:uncharacterized protein FIESC28_01020 [Fusarium coffeatum]RBR26237.1 hypothetical protein FIESC28_01020 [Fusarium coffeatum]
MYFPKILHKDLSVESGIGGQRLFSDLVPHFAVDAPQTRPQYRTLDPVRVAHHEWDGRCDLLLPFCEEQNELTEAVATLGPNEASRTVDFAHLAINKAITQRHVVGIGVDNPGAANSIPHRGLKSPNRFASLARTFMGHFHSHQTITQEQSDSSKVDLQGSVIYLGSSLQLNRADFYDEQRGVALFDLETLEDELLINPHAVGYITADLQQFLSGQVDERAVTDKHVMLIAKLTHLKYVTARDKLLSLGVRSWSRRVGAAVQLLEEPTSDEADLAVTTDSVSGSDTGSKPRSEKLDPAAEAREYAESLDLDKSLLLRRHELVRVGKRMIQVSCEITD